MLSKFPRKKKKKPRQKNLLVAVNKAVLTAGLWGKSRK